LQRQVNTGFGCEFLQGDNSLFIQPDALMFALVACNPALFARQPHDLPFSSGRSGAGDKKHLSHKRTQNNAREMDQPFATGTFTEITGARAAAVDAALA
jgi:hypothetical protein